ncbi:MAG: efflux RND transporter periplasmic adaptor subunit [Myxococcota bacterium]
MRTPKHGIIGTLGLTTSLLFIGTLATACGDSKGQGPEALAPGKCEPGANGEEAAQDEPPPGVVKLTPEQEGHARITTAKVEKRAAAGLLLATAEIEPAADGVAKVGTRVASRVISLAAGLGDRVEKGAVLAEVDAPELGRAKADYQSALAAARVTRDTAAREKVLAADKISSERDWRAAEAEAAKARAEKDAAESRLLTLGLSAEAISTLGSERPLRSTMQVTAPIAGVVTERPVTLGQMVEPADLMFTIMDAKVVWVVVDVFEQDLAQLSVGQAASVRVAAFEGRTFEGQVTDLGAIVEAKTRTVKVRVVVPNPDGALRPGMFAQVELAGTTGEAREALYVPGGAIQRDGDKSMVFVVRGEREYERRVVTLGRTAGAGGELVALLSGVSPGESVVVDGSFILKSELQKGELGEDE